MALVRTDFNPGSSTGNAPAIHCYTTIDTQAEVNTAGYFNGLSSILRVGDLIYAACDTDGTAGYFFFPVLSNAAGVVDVADGLAIGVTDTD